MNEKILIKRARLGDPEAFMQLIEPYRLRVYNIALSLLGNTGDAEDAAQETFLRVFRHLTLFSGTSCFYTWLYRITKNVCYDMLKKRSRAAARNIPIYGDDSSPMDIPDSSPSPEDIAAQNETSAKVQRCIASLKPDYAAILTLRDIEGLSYEEISAILKISSGTVKSRLSRARNKLKEKIIREYPELLEH